MRFRTLLACVLAAVTVGCSPSPTTDRAQIAAISKEANATIAFLLANPGTDVAKLPIPDAMKSAGVTRLHKSNPGTLYDGLYMGVSGVLAADAGYFVPSEPERFNTKDGIGVVFTPLGEGVFWYEINR